MIVWQLLHRQRPHHGKSVAAIRQLAAESEGSGTQLWLPVAPGSDKTLAQVGPNFELSKKSNNSLNACFPTWLRH
jgi:hypothetical protein